MTDRPINSRAHEVRALLDGRKTMARFEAWRRVSERRQIRGDDEEASSWQLVQPGDLLWVRESWGAGDRFYQCHDVEPPRVIAYRADKSALNLWQPVPDYDIAQWNWNGVKWRPSIHMPRWASRLTLEVTATKIERLQDISEEDARAEGVEPAIAGVDKDGGPLHTYRTGFVYVWRDLHGPESWLANPEVVALTFKAHRCNIDAMPKAAAA